MYSKGKRQASLKSPQRHAKSGLDLKVVYRRLDELKCNPTNPRRHSNKQIRQIADSLEAFGFVVPVMIDRDDNVIAGHGRMLACPLAGVTEVPTLCLDHLTRAQARRS
jgi:ParB-like chromosome segregation protein Spo0J